MAQPQIDHISVGVRVYRDKLQGVDQELRELLTYSNTVRITLSAETLAKMSADERFAIERLNGRVVAISKKVLETA